MSKFFIRTQRQNGSVWIILLVLVVLVVGSWQYSAYKSEQKRIAQEAARQRVEEQRREAERQQLERRLAEEKRQRDALTSANKALDDLLGRWEDAVKVAGTTGRIALSGPVTTLQNLRRETEQLTVSPCLDQPKSLLVQSMGSTIEGFLTFMRNELKIGDTLAQIDFDAAGKHMAAFRAARANCPQ